MNIPADLFGYLGMLAGVSFMLPQVYKSWRTKSVEDIAWGMLILLTTNNISWFTYGAFLGSMPLMLTNGIGLIVIGTQVFLKLRYRKV